MSPEHKLHESVYLGILVIAISPASSTVGTPGKLPANIYWMNELLVYNTLVCINFSEKSNSLHIITKIQCYTFNKLLLYRNHEKTKKGEKK